jgi:hypothetical protein
MNTIFEKTKAEILKIIQTNLEKDNDVIWEKVRERFPSVPEYVLRSVMSSLTEEK